MGSEHKQCGKRETYERGSICIWVLCDVSQKVPAWHPIRDEFKGFHGHTQKGDNILMFQVSRGYNDLMEDLRDSGVSENRET